MDYTTLIFSIFGISLASCISMAILFWTRHTYPGFEFWAAGTACRVMACGLFLLPRSIYPAWVTIGVANFMIIAETLCYLRGTLLFRGRPTRPWIEFLVFAVYIALFAYYIYVDSRMNVRIAIRMFINSALEVWLIGILLTKRPAYFGIGDIWQAAIWGVLSLAGFGLAAYSIGNVPAIAGTTSLFIPHSQLLNLLLLLSCAFMITMSQIIMNAQRFEYDHGKLQKQLEKDVTSLQDMHDRLQTSEARHRLLADNSIDVIWTMTLDGRVTYVNPAIEKLRGFTPLEFMNLPLEKRYTSESLKIVIEGLKRAKDHIEAGLLLDFPRQEIEGICKDGSTVWTEVSATGIYDNQGKFVEVLGITRDISDRKIREAQKEKLSILNHRLEKTESLTRMAGAVAHHFNNKLMGVTGNLEIAISRLSDENTHDEFKKSVFHALDSANQAVEVSTMMLTYLGEVNFRPKVIDLSEFCQGFLVSMNSETPANVEMRSVVPRPGPVVNVDPKQVERMLRNLVDNAWEATGENRNTVTVSIRKVKAGDIPSALRNPADFHAEGEDYACVQVSDTGTGIDASHLGKLCDPFYTTKFTGRGVGLATVLGFVRSSGGVLTVQSQSGKGSVFSVFLPVVGFDP